MISSPSLPPNPPRRLSVWTKLAYGSGDMGAAMTGNILIFFLFYFFTNVAGLDAALAGLVLLISKIWDAVNDPLVGVLSDRTQSPWGRRYPWMLGGALPFGLLFVLQWLVPTTDQWGLFGYYVAIALFFNMAYTAVNLPYTALTPELTQDYNERTSLNSFRFAFSLGGAILSLVLAQVIFGVISDQQAQYLYLGGAIALLSTLPIFWCVFGTWHQTLPATRSPAKAGLAPPLTLWAQIRIAFGNQPFLYVMGIYLFSWLAVQVTATIIPLFVVDWMGLPEEAFIQVALVVQGTALIWLFIWGAVSERLGKKAVYFMGVGVWILAQAGLLFLQPGQVTLMYLTALMAGVGVSTAYLIPWSMLPDVIEVDELQTGERREGIFYGLMVLLQKMGLALGIFLVGQALDWAGFVEKVAGQPAPLQPPSALLAIRIAIGPLPTLCLLAGLVLAYFYPLTKECHAEVLLRLQERRSQHSPPKHNL